MAEPDPGRDRSGAVGALERSVAPNSHDMLPPFCGDWEGGSASDRTPWPNTSPLRVPSDGSSPSSHNETTPLRSLPGSDPSLVLVPGVSSLGLRLRPSGCDVTRPRASTPGYKL